MPNIFRIDKYIVYFWSNEESCEPVHVHIAIGKPTPDATKLCIDASGKINISHNNSLIPEKGLRRLIDLIGKNSDIIVEAWSEHFGEVKYFC